MTLYSLHFSIANINGMEYMKTKYLLMVPLLSIGFYVNSASFDCSRSQTNVEKQICSSSTLSKLDEILSHNYTVISASDIGDSARQTLKQSQRKWIAMRNSCNDFTCLEKSYTTRIEEICNNYPVLSGSFPDCISVEQAMTEGGNNPLSTSGNSYTSGANTQRANVVDEKSLGLSVSDLNSNVYLKRGLTLPYQKMKTLKDYILSLQGNSSITSIVGINQHGYKGILVKVSGQPSIGFLFRFEDGEAYITRLVEGDQASVFESEEQEIKASSIFLDLFI